jgi:hypothetical protein
MFLETSGFLQSFRGFKLSATILNTDANINAKTVLIAEGAATITGLQTFDRDPNPPFAVSSGSAVVPNLDADKLDGIEGAAFVQSANLVWSTWTPTLTNLVVGNGTMQGKYLQINKLVFVDLHFTFGATSTFGAGAAWTFTYPVTAADAFGQVFSVYMLDSGSNLYTGVGTPASTTTFTLNPSVTSSAGSPVLDTGSVTNTNPHTWAVNDQLRISGFFRAA